jgi:hypothetical protein
VAGPAPPEALPPLPLPLPPAPDTAPDDDELQAASASNDAQTTEWSPALRASRFFIREASFFAAVAALPIFEWGGPDPAADVVLKGKSITTGYRRSLGLRRD